MPSGYTRDSHVKFYVIMGLLGFGLVGALAFGVWAYGQALDYKNNVDAKITVAVKQSEQATTEKNNAAYAELAKSPLKEYVGPSSYGTVKVQYPKTWSAYISAGSDSNTPLDAQFHPDYVPAEANSSSGDQAIALTVQVVGQSYDSIVSNMKSKVQSGAVTATPYSLPKMPNQVGVKFSGKIDEKYNGEEVVIPLRDKTLIIRTQSDKYTEDFNKYILPNMTFVP